MSGAKRARRECGTSLSTIRVRGDDHFGVCDSAAFAAILCAESPYCDASFPAAAASILGQEPAAPHAPPPVLPSGGPPTCGCGRPATKCKVKSNTPNKGREYWSCRQCRFFAWADGRGNKRPRSSPLSSVKHWKRFRSLEVVSVFGFRAQDLAQGGVGDCWMMSALAVVAERHDLIAKLFAPESMQRNAVGAYSLRLFLDGYWKEVVVDDRLPVTLDPRRPELAFDSGIAFCRAGSPQTGHQLWASLLEKAYAKAHGSYRAISGGEIAEALLDLTGAPTLTVDFGADGFDSERLWAQLRACRRCELPCGCATAPDPQLREVGLCGSHAYSILDVREVERRVGSSGWSTEVVRLVRVRNPHGMGEWLVSLVCTNFSGSVAVELTDDLWAHRTGEWSDHSDAWADLIRSSGGRSSSAGAPALESPIRTGTDDGTFWIDWTHFLMAFSVVDMSLAFRGWHARSFSGGVFPDKRSNWRLSEVGYRVRVAAATASAENECARLFVMSLQPSKRGSWCRSDRKKSYRAGDLSVLILKETPACSNDRAAPASTQAGAVSVVGGGFRGADTQGAKGAFGAVLDDREATYLVLVLALGTSPTAAESRKEQPFALRILSNVELEVMPVQLPAPGSPPRYRADAPPALEPAVVLRALHAATTRPQQQRRQGRFGQQQMRFGVEPDSVLLMPSSTLRRLRRLPTSRQDLAVFASTGDGAVVLLAAHVGSPDSPHLCISALALAKSFVARGAEGLIKNDAPKAKEYGDAQKRLAEELQAQAAAMERRSNGKPPFLPPPRAGGGFRWPAKWAAYRTAPVYLRPGEQRVLMVLARSGVQGELGDIECDVSVVEGACRGGGKRKATVGAALMQSWLQNNMGDSRSEQGERKRPRSHGVFAEGIFSPIALQPETLTALERCATCTHTVVAAAASGTRANEAEDAMVEAALAASLGGEDLRRRDDYDRDGAVMEAALAASLADQRGGPEDALAAVLRQSEQEAAARAAAEAEDEARLERALALSRGCGGDVVCADEVVIID